MKTAEPKIEESVRPASEIENPKVEESAQSPLSAAADEASQMSDEEYWERMLFISRGPTGWNIGCGCG